MNIFLWLKDLLNVHLHIHKDQNIKLDIMVKCPYTQDARNLLQDINKHSHGKI